MSGIQRLNLPSVLSLTKIDDSLYGNQTMTAYDERLPLRESFYNAVTSAIEESLGEGCEWPDIVNCLVIIMEKIVLAGPDPRRHRKQLADVFTDYSS